MEKVAYIIVSWNNKKLLSECINSIDSQQGVLKKIVLVDNASSDGTAEYIRKEYPFVELIAENKNHAFAKGNNIGISHALQDEEVKFVALVNTDATLDPNWTETLVKFAKNKTRAAALQTITLDYFDHNTIDSTHIYISHSGQATQGSWRRPLMTGTDVAPQRVFGCNAAAVMYTRDFIERQPFSRFFDETMWMYLEDVDVSARATVMGWENYVVPGARAYHMGSASSSKNPGFSLYYTYRNNLGLLIKNLPFVIILKLLPKLVRGDIETIKVLKATKRPHLIKVIIKGRVASLLFIPVFLLKRVKLKRVINLRYLWRLMLRGF